MFILYGILAGLLVGLLAHGRIAGLASVRIRWAPAIVVGLVVQVILFSDAVAARAGDLGPPIYVASTVLVLAAVVRNWAIPGMPLVIAGAACNLAAIVANGGYMPAGEAAMRALDKVESTVYSNSAVAPDPVLWFLTDIFAMPRGMPFANIFSLGDILIAVGMAMVIVLAMRRPAPARGATHAASGAPTTPELAGEAGASAH
jgi:hypothetical protein